MIIVLDNDKTLKMNRIFSVATRNLEIVRYRRKTKFTEVTGRKMAENRIISGARRTAYWEK